MKKIRVKILETGTEGKEINPLGEMEPDIISTPLSWDSESLFADQNKWKQAEASLKTYEIDYEYKIGAHRQPYFEPLPVGTIHDAIELENGKIKIL